MFSLIRLSWAALLVAGLPFSPAHAQPDDPNQPVRFAVIGDYGTFRTSADAVAAEVKRWNPAFILTVGDNNYPFGEAETIDANIGQRYHEFIHPYRGRFGEGAETNRFFPALGNHDWNSMACDGNDCAGPYFDYFDLPGNERYYDVVWGPVHLFILNSGPVEPDGLTDTSAQAAWLRERLAESDACWKIVALHHAPYVSGRQNGSTPAAQWPYAEWGASAVLAGHEHFYERIERDGIPYFVNGSGGMVLYPLGTPVAGSQVRYNARWGAMQIDASCGEITYRFVTDEGETIDTRNVRKPAGLRFDEIDAVQDGTDVEVAWTTHDEINVTGFTIERSLNGGTFETVAASEPTGGYQVRRSYDVSLPNLPDGSHTYRIRWTGPDGQTDVSSTVTLDVVGSGVDVQTFRATQLRFDTVQLDWETTAETLLAGFVLEELVGADSARVVGAFQPVGTSTTPQSDTYSLTIPGLEEGAHTFRLRWTGLDGRAGVLDPVTLDIVGPGAAFRDVRSTQVRFNTVRFDWATAGEVFLEALLLEEVLGPESARVAASVEPTGTSVEPRDGQYTVTLTDLEERTYTYRMRWIGQGGRTGASAPFDVAVVRASAQFDSVRAHQSLDVLEIDWQTTGEFMVDDFVLERAAPDSPFVAAAVLPAEGAPHAYTVRLDDLSPALYRLRIRWRGTDDWTGIEPIEPVRMTPVLRLDTLVVGQDGEDVRLAWSTSGEYAARSFTLEARGPDAQAFTAVDELPAAGTTREGRSYAYRLTRPGVGDYTFRLAWTDTEGRTALAAEQPLTVESDADLVDFRTDFLDSRIVLTWQARGEIYLDGYAAEREDGPDAFTEVGQVPAGATVPGVPDDTTRTYRFAIDRLDNGVYTYRVRWIGQDGRTGLSDVREIEVAHPFTLEPAYPNPFVVQTRIGFSLPQAAEVRLEVIDMLGRQVAVIDDGERPAGPHELVVPGAGLASGVYVYRLFVDDGVAFRRTFVVQR